MPEDLHDEQARRIAAEEALRRSQQRLDAQSEALTALTAPHTAGSGRFRAVRAGDPLAGLEPDRLGDRLRAIVETCARTLETARVSIWRFTDDRDGIRCVDLYDAAARSHAEGDTLSRAHYPDYFRALEHERVIAADDARRDPRTSAFLAGYLVPHDIGAMLDVPLRRKDDLIGVVCAEHVGGPRAWTVDERNFMVSVANLVVVAILDHERRAVLRQLAENEARARLILDTAHDAFIGMDEQGAIVAWNAQAAATFGWAAGEVVGRSLGDTIIPERFREAHARGLARFLATGKAPVVNTRLELAAIHRDGREFPIEITITRPIRTDSGHFFGAFLRDISERHQKEEELRRAKESAEAATRAKSEFLANMSHELRTPLNGVLGYTQLLQRERGLPSRQREALDAIAKCGAHLLDLINDVLDLSKIEAGRVDLDPAPCDIRQVTVDVKYVVAEPAHRRGLRLQLEVAPDVPRRAVLDGRHLRQVLLNLLGNAVKFTHAGEVRLSIRRTGTDRLIFEVADTGIGIDREQLPAIFEAFGQTRDGAAAGGTGLGLTISQRLVRAMGGELQVASEAGQGSRFFFELPLVESPGGDAAPPPESEVSELMLDSHLAPGVELTALVADDSSVNRRILASLLESAGARVITAAGGLEAIALAAQHHPDVILMDLRMEDLDGFEATRRLKADPETATIPVLAVTASAFGDVRQAAVAAGCVDFVPKPVRAERLFAKLQQHLGARFIRPDDVVTVETAMPDVVPVPPALAARLREAAAIGNVEALDALVQELTAAGGAEAALGAQIARLVAAFDYEGLLALAAAPGPETGGAGAYS
jgi:PAS domain S-box-containing protein